MRPNPAAAAFVRWTLSHGRALWLTALLLAIPAAQRTADLYMHLRSAFEELLPEDAPSVQAIGELRARMPGLQHIGVVVDTGTPQRLGAGEAFLDDLAAKIGQYPPDLVIGVRVGSRQEAEFFREKAPLYLELSELDEIRSRIEARRDYEVTKAQGALIDPDAPAPSLDFTDIEQAARKRLGDASPSFAGGRFSSSERHLTMLLIDLGEFSTGDSRGHELVTRLRGDVAALRASARHAPLFMSAGPKDPGARVGLTGELVVNAEETAGLVTDLSTSSAFVLLAVASVIVLYYRWGRSIVILVLPLLLATTYTFALASLPPFRITALNSNTAFLGSIIVGNGINFGIILLARYVEERRRGSATADALVTAVWSSRLGTLPAALAAGVSYAALVVTQFRGFRQFGFIGAIGMLAAWSTSFLLMPPLIAWLDSGERTRPQQRRGSMALSGIVAGLVRGHPGIVAAVGIVLTTVSALEIPRFDMSEIELDLSKLRRADTWTQGDGYWSRMQDALLGRYLTPTLLLTDSAEEARALASRLRQAAQRPPLADMISVVRTAEDLVPADQEAKIAVLQSIRAELSPKMLSLIPADGRPDIERLLRGTELEPVGLADLPDSLRRTLVERNGSAGRAVLVYPSITEPLWEAGPLFSFVSELRALAAESARSFGPGARPARVAGALPVSADILDSVAHDGPVTTAIAFVAVVAVVFMLFGRHRTTLYVAGSLAVAVLWLFATTTAFKIRINFANFIAFPITFGIGVDYAVNLVTRYVQDGERDPADAVSRTGGAVALCSMTTILGYSSLLLAENRALFLFGLVAVLGEICCLSTAIALLPATLILVRRRKGRVKALPART